jgi:predicted TIM-barrel fold metal-dependent hydrolase
MLSSNAEIISVDDHIIEPENLWTSRLASKYGQDIPHVVHKSEGDFWAYADSEEPMPRLAVLAGTSRESWGDGNPRFSEIDPACYDSKARLSRMDEDGVAAQLCFPNYPRFAGHRFLRGDNRELALDCVRAWNDFVVEEWCAVDPRRFIPLSILPLWDVGACVAEVRRAAAMGVRAVAFSEDPTLLGLPSIYSQHWDAVVGAIQETDLVLCMHIGSSSSLIKKDHSPESPDPAWSALVGVNSMFAAVDWVFSGILKRYPDVRIALSEGGAGWAPYVVERMDYEWEKRGVYSEVDLDRRPSEIFREHFGLCMLKDRVAVECREMIGVENLMFESDFPHADSVFPDSRKVLTECLIDVPDEESALIAAGNARRWFRFGQ